MDSPQDSPLDLRQQVMQSTSLLLRAVDRLAESSSSSNSRTPSAQGSTTSTSTCTGPGENPVPRHQDSRSNASSSSCHSGSKFPELSRLFHWGGSRQDTTSGIKRKGPKSGGSSKKKKLKMYRHTFVALLAKANSESILCGLSAK